MIAPYGTWQSPIAADLVARRTGRPGWVGVVGDEIWWTEPRPTEGGRVALATFVMRGILPACAAPVAWAVAGSQLG